MTPAAHNGQTLELSREEIVQCLERGAEKRLGMTARKMVCAYRKGKLEDPGEVTDLLILASLLKEDDPLFVPA